jgi:hypothetical protein
MLVFTGVEVGTVPLRGGPAALELHQLADAAAAQPDQPVQDVQLIQTTGWWLTTTVGSRKPGGPSTLDPVSLDMYYLPDGNVRAIERRGKPLDPAQGLVDPVGEWVKLSDETFESRKEGSQYVQTLPTEPQALTAELVPHPNRCNNATWCLANQIAQLHYSYVVPSGVEAAMWDALASAPGVEFLGHASDRLGRNAVAFVTDGDGPIRQTIIFADRDTGAFLGTEVILIKDSLELGVDSPAVIEFTALVGARWTDIDNLPPLP